MISPVVFSDAVKINGKLNSVKSSVVNKFDLPCVKDLTSTSSDSFVKSKVVKGPTCGIDCCAL